MKKICFILLFMVLINTKAYASTYSFLFGVPDSVIIGDNESSIIFNGRIINNGIYPLDINGGGAGPDPYNSSPYPWWETNFWTYDIQGSTFDIQPGETRDFQLGIFKDDPLIQRGYTYLFSFFFTADLDSDGNHDIGTPYQYYDSNGWLFDGMAHSLVTIGGSSYVSSNYHYVESSLSPNYNPPVVPEPISSTLFIIGGGVLAARRYLGRKLSS